MINKYYLTFMLLLLGAMLSSCGSDDDGMDSVKPVTPPASGTSWTVDVVAETTRGLSVSGNVLTQSWSTTDNIFVYYKNQEVGVLHPETSGTSGVVKLLGNIDTPATPYEKGEELFFCYRHHMGFSNYSGQDGTLEKIASDYDFATADAKITFVNENERKLTVELASFQSQQAIVKFTFKRGDANNGTIPDKPVKSVTVSSNALGGDITINSSPATNVLYVALPVSSTEEKPYYITTIDENDNPDFVGKLPSIALQNGKYYTSEVRLYEAVQLWEGGPMWAKNNVEPSTGKYDSDGGPYFCWDGTDGRNHASLFDWNHYPDGSTPKKYKTNGMTLATEDDAAYVNWGKACRIPRNDEFSALITNTTHEWSSSGTKGITFKGKTEGYTDKSIFLPAKGYLTATLSGTQHSDKCYYWSSSCIVENSKYYGGGLKAEYTSGTVSAVVDKWEDRYIGKPIRAIIDWK